MVEYINWRRLRGWGKRDESELGIAEQDLRKMEVACGKLADGFGEQAVDGTGCGWDKMWLSWR